VNWCYWDCYTPCHIFASTEVKAYINLGIAHLSRLNTMYAATDSTRSGSLGSMDEQRVRGDGMPLVTQHAITSRLHTSRLFIDYSRCSEACVDAEDPLATVSLTRKLDLGSVRPRSCKMKSRQSFPRISRPQVCIFVVDWSLPNTTQP